MEIKPRKSFGKGTFNFMRYLTQGTYPPDKCTICGIKRTDEFGEPKWKSDLLIKDYFHNGVVRVMTVCPKCRELPLNRIYEKIIEKDAHSKTTPRKKRG
jgi:hypothetical protein